MIFGGLTRKNLENSQHLSPSRLSTWPPALFGLYWRSCRSMRDRPIPICRRFHLVLWDRISRRCWYEKCKPEKRLREHEDVSWQVDYLLKETADKNRPLDWKHQTEWGITHKFDVSGRASVYNAQICSALEYASLSWMNALTTTQCPWPYPEEGVGRYWHKLRSTIQTEHPPLFEPTTQYEQPAQAWVC